MKEMGTPDVHKDTGLYKAVLAKGIRNVSYHIQVQLPRKHNKDENLANMLYMVVTYIPATTSKSLQLTWMITSCWLWNKVIKLLKKKKTKKRKSSIERKKVERDALFEEGGQMILIEGIGDQRKVGSKPGSVRDISRPTPGVVVGMGVLCLMVLEETTRKP